MAEDIETLQLQLELLRRRAAIPPIPEVQQPELVSPESRRRMEIGERVLALTEGATLGLSPEISDFLRQAGVTPTEGPSQAEVLAGMDPEQRIVGNLAGGLLQGAATAAALPAQATATAPRIAALAAAEGAIGGAGFAEGGAAERLRGAGIGAATGAGLGLIIPSAISGFQALGRRTVARASGLTRPQRRAVNLILDELRENLTTPEEAVNNIRALGADAVLADVPELRPFAAAVASTRPARIVAEEFLTQRSEAARGRISAAIRGITEAQNFGDFMTDLIERRARNASRLYSQALGAGELQETDDLAKLIGRLDQDRQGNLIRRGGSRAVQNAIREIKGDNPDLRDLPDTHMEILDRVYKRLVERSFGPGAPKRNLAEVKGQLLDAIAGTADNPGQVPIYRDAVNTFADSKALEEAAAQGRKFLREDSFVTTNIIRDMTDGEREAFMVGVTRGMLDEVEKGTQRANVAARVFSSRNRPKISAALGGPDRYNDFRRVMERELEFAETAGLVRPGAGSQTQRLQAGTERLRRRAGRAVRMGRRLARTEPLGVVEEVLTPTGPRPPVTPQESEALAQFLFQSQAPAGNLPLESTPLSQLLLQESLRAAPTTVQRRVGPAAAASALAPQLALRPEETAAALSSLLFGGPR